MWYTQRNDNKSVESCPNGWEKCKEAFLRKYFRREKNQVKIEEFINLRQGKMSKEEYSLKFTLLSKYAPFLVSNLRDKMSRFLISVSIF